MSVESGYIDLEDMSGSEGRPSPTSSVFLPLNELMDRVRTFVRERGIMLEDCFHDYDPLRTGYVNASDFNKALKEVFEELLADEQVEEIQNQYCVHSSPDCFNWSKFLHDAETEEPLVPQNNNMQPQKTELLKRVARLMKGKMDLSNLLCQMSSQNSKRNGENGYTIDKQSEDVPQLLAAVIEKEELKAIMDMYTDENGFKCQEFLQDLKKVEECHKKSRPPSRSTKVCPKSLGFSIDIPEDQVHSSKSSKLSIKRSRKPFSISYEALVWIIFTIVTTLCVVDRFVLKGDVVLGRAAKFPKRLWGTNIGETITNVVWGVTARMIITSQNLMFYTMLWCIPNFISEIAPNWIILDGIRDVHSRIHTFAGIFLMAIPSLAHVLVIFVPPLIDGTSLKYYPPSTFNYSKYPDHLNWSEFWDPAAVQGWTFNDHTGVHLTADEIYRFLIIIVIFCIFVPLSRSYYANHRSYSLAMALHIFAGIWYAVDNIRKITHGLSQVTNLPILALWCFDRLLSIWIYRYHHGRIVRKEVIGNNEYVVMYVKLDKDVKHAVGDVYYLLHQVKGNTGILPQRSHPFTTFANVSQDSTWDIGFVISILEDEEQMCLPWTSWLAHSQDTLRFHVWGPYRSSVWKLYKQLVDVTDGQSPSHFVLFATGSGCGYILDVLSCLAHKSELSEHGSQTCKKTQIDIFYSVRCKAFYYSLRKTIDELLKKIKEKNTATVNFQFYVTGEAEEELEEREDDHQAETQIQLINGRIDFEKALKPANKKSCCYFVGRPVIAENIEKICQRKGIRLVKDYTNGRGNGQDRRLLMKYLKITFWVVFIITAICLIIRLVIDVKTIKHSIQTISTNNTK